MLFLELILYVLIYIVERTAIDIAGHSEGEHVLALKDRSFVKTAFRQTLLGQLGNRSDDYRTILNSQFLEGVISGKTSLFHAALVKCILIDEDHSCPFEPLGVSF